MLSVMPAKIKSEKEKIEAKNEADAAIYNSEKTMKDLGDKVGSSERSKLESAISALKDAMSSDNLDFYAGKNSGTYTGIIMK